MVNIEMANGKNIKIELYPDVAPKIGRASCRERV